MHRIRKSIEFAMAHRLQHHEGLCRNVHGHTYRVEVELEWPTVDGRSGMVRDFADIKAALDEYVKGPCDHAMCFDLHDTLMGDMFIGGGEGGGEHHEDIADALILKGYVACPGVQGLKLYVMDRPPSAENLSKLWSLLLEKDPRMIGLSQVIVHESPTSCASYSIN